MQDESNLPNKGSDNKNQYYSCPIYANPARTDLTYVTTVQLKCPPYVKKISAPPDTMKKGKNKKGEIVEDYGKIATSLLPSDQKYWILQGTAIICNVN